MKIEQRLYNLPIPIIGLTGGIASGKSTVSKLFSEKGYPVICADELVHQIYTLPETLQWMKENFSEHVQNEKINFQSLRELFFNDPQTKSKLEDYIYQKLPAVFLKNFQNVDQSKGFVIYDIPLLFEKNLQDKFDRTLLVYTPADTQTERLIKRDHISLELAQKIIAQQMPIEQKKCIADIVLENTADIQTLFNRAMIEIAKIEQDFS